MFETSPPQFHTLHTAYWRVRSVMVSTVGPRSLELLTEVTSVDFSLD